LHAYEALMPEVISDALEALGFQVDGRLSALSSYENRVYLAMLESGEGVVAKFYRPKRWSLEQILEEHAFAFALTDAEVPVVAPFIINGLSLFSTKDLGLKVPAEFLFSVSPKRGGRSPNLDDPDVLMWLGRYMARIHSVGQQEAFKYRENLDLQTLGLDSVSSLIQLDAIPHQFKERWILQCEIALDIVRQAFNSRPQSLRIHGDCHSGNILWTPQELQGGGPHFVDLDDARMGPAVQDLWMLLSGDRAERTFQLSSILEGYTSIRPFASSELALIEPLRTLRMVHYSAWLAKRADDPSFVINFPWFWSPDYWQTQIDILSEQIEAMQEPPLFSQSISY